MESQEKKDVQEVKKATTAEEKEIERLSKLTFEKVDKDKAKEHKKNVHKEALKLIRCQISCNNKNKTSYQGEIFSAQNKAIPEVKKFIPFNVPTHVPQILLNMIKEKQYQMFKTEKLPNGNQIKRPYLVPEYSIQMLPPLTAEEFNSIKQKQLAEGERG